MENWNWSSVLGRGMGGDHAIRVAPVIYGIRVAPVIEGRGEARRYSVIDGAWVICVAPVAHAVPRPYTEGGG